MVAQLMAAINGATRHASVVKLKCFQYLGSSVGHKKYILGTDLTTPLFCNVNLSL